MRTLFVTLALLAAARSAAAVPRFDYRQPMPDGTALVGVECQYKQHTLQLNYFYPDKPPARRMDLWRTSDLVRFDPKTFFLQEVLKVERQCTVGKDHYKVRFTGVPGANNATWLCGASTGARATVWKNGKQVFDEDMAVCQQEGYMKTIRFMRDAEEPAVQWSE